MSERLPDYSPPTESTRTAPPYRTAPPESTRLQVRPPQGDQPFVPPPDSSSWMRPLAFGGALVAVLVIALVILFVPMSSSSERLSKDELAALIEEPPEQGDLPPLWATPTQPSDLEVITVPAGASVQLNNEWVGFTPIRLDQNPPGYYTLSISAPDHARKDTAFYLASGSFLQVDVELDPFEPMPMLSEPVSSPVAEDTRPPRRIERRAEPAAGGTASQEVSQPGEESQFEVASPEDVRRAAHSGSLSVTSNPSGAIVFVDGVPFGRAPLSLSDLRPGSYVVTVTLPGLVPVTYQAEVTAQSVAVVKAVFPPPGE